MDGQLTLLSLTKQLAIPEDLLPFLEQAVLVLPGEEETHFLKLFSMMALDLDPQSYLEWFTVIDATGLLWDMQRYRRWKNAFITLHHSSAVGEAFLKTHPSFRLLGYTETIHAEARLEHEAWCKEAGRAAKLPPRLDAMGYTQDGLLASAFAQIAETIASIEQLLTSCRRQYNRVVNEATVRREFRNSARRFAARMQTKDVGPSNKNE